MYKIKAKITQPGYIRISVTGLHPLLKSTAIRIDYAIGIQGLNFNPATMEYSLPKESGVDDIANWYVDRILEEFWYQMDSKSADKGDKNPYADVKFLTSYNIPKKPKTDPNLWYSMQNNIITIGEENW